jgi:hypothetical protein
MPAVKFTKANAREMSIKANHERWHGPNANPGKVAKAPVGIPDAVPDGFNGLRLVRVRKQLVMIEASMDKLIRGKDPAREQKLDRLASALARVSEIERGLAGRALPAPYKVSQRGSKRSRRGPVDE